MIIVCTECDFSVTIGKHYLVIDGSDRYGEYFILGDDLIKRWYISNRFKLLNNIREEQLKIILE